MELTFTGRLNLGTILPEKSDIITMSLARDVKEKILITEKEIKKYNLKTAREGDKTGYSWDVEKEEKEPVEIALSSAEIDMLKNQVTILDKKKEISDNLLNICKKIKNA